MKVKTLVTNAILAALYMAVSTVIQPFGFTRLRQSQKKIPITPN